jgi:hypothetical protein
VPSAPFLLSLTYRAAVAFYPPAFRAEFGEELQRDFEEAAAEVWRHGGRGDRLRFLVAIGRDLTTTVVTQWLRTGMPAVALISVSLAALMTTAAVKLRSGPAWTHAVRPEDQELLTVMLLIGVVLLVIVVTIFFTLYFLRPKRLRRRM